jgi:hypothetical protein
MPSIFILMPRYLYPRFRYQGTEKNIFNSFALCITYFFVDYILALLYLRFARLLVFGISLFQSVLATAHHAFQHEAYSGAGDQRYLCFYISTFP